MHQTVLTKEECDSLLKGCLRECPFCKYTSMPQLVYYHIKNHFQMAVIHQDFTIVKCSLSCRAKSHFHCCYCSETLLNRAQFLAHISKHSTIKSSPTQPHSNIASPHQTSDVPPPQPGNATPLQPSKATPLQPSKATPLQPGNATPLQPSKATPLQPGKATPPQPGNATPLQPSKATPLQPGNAAPLQPGNAAPLQPGKAAPLQPGNATPLQPGNATPLQPGNPTLPQPSVDMQKHTAKKTVTCSQCNLTLLVKNLRTHIRRKHTEKDNAITPDRHLRCQCIDNNIGIFAVEKAFHGQATPIHVKKNTWGPNFQSECELEQCNLNADVAHNSGILAFECCHVKSLAFCPLVKNAIVPLTENTLSHLVEQKWFGEARKAQLLQLQQKANTAETPLSFHVTVGGPSNKHFISVFEPVRSYYSKMGRVMVAYDKKKNKWHCPCARPRQSCIHKATAKWHLFQTFPELFRKIKSSEEVFSTVQHTDDPSSQDISYPPSFPTVKRMIKYMLEHKKIPQDIPQTIIEKSKYGKIFGNNILKHLAPHEVECKMCNGVLSEPKLITCQAKIVTFNGVIEGVSTYYKLCRKCNLTYRYQEWCDGLHNFNDRIILSLHLCVVFRNSLQNHTAISRVVGIIAATEGESLPKGDLIMQAYLHFEALCDLDYMYSCVSCGYNPSTVVMDLHKKEVFSIPVSEIPSPPATYDGLVDVENFWEAVAMDMISRGFYPSGKQNPFVMSPSYHYWSPWIGPKTRKSAMVLNTECAKVHSSEDESDVDLPFTEERLGDELLHLKIKDLKKLCRQCGVDVTGSKMDLILRIRSKMSNRVTYNKVFQQVWGASGGLGVIMCPCGIVYSLKFNLRAESPRDFADILLSWQHFPNVTIYDYPRGLVAHMNKRNPLSPPFHPFEGRVQEPSKENIEMAKQGKLQVHFPWLARRKTPADPDCHPLTGSSEHYCLCDVFHQNNSKDEKDVLRNIGLVPELAGKINSECVEQLFSAVKKNNYFMNMLRPSAHIFLCRNILHHRNIAKNKIKMEQFKKSVHGKYTLKLDCNGKAVLEAEPNVGLNYPEASPATNNNVEDIHTAVQSQPDPECHSPAVITALNLIKASRVFWGSRPNDVQKQLLDHALDIRRCPKEQLSTVYNTTITRSDLCSLGLLQDVEGTVLNCCLKVIETIAKAQNVKVFSANSYHIATWPQRTPEEHLSHLPLDIDLDWYIYPTWVPGHWLVCIMKPKEHCIFFLDSLSGNTFRQEDYMSIYRSIAQILSPGPWHEYCVNEMKGVPRQHFSNSCGVFVLMYSLYLVTSGTFDFAETDMPCIRKWWCLLLLENFPLWTAEQRRAKRIKMRHTKEQKPNASPVHLLDLPKEVLEKILLDVVHHDGDAAYLTLGVTCKGFNALVCTPQFQKKAHFAWLDSVVNFKIWSEESKAEFRVPFKIKECSKCNMLFKSCSGFIGNGKRGVLQGFYDSIEDPDCCFMCQ